MEQLKKASKEEHDGENDNTDTCMLKAITVIEDFMNNALYISDLNIDQSEEC